MSPIPFELPPNGEMGDDPDAARIKRQFQPAIEICDILINLKNNTHPEQ